MDLSYKQNRNGFPGSNMTGEYHYLIIQSVYNTWSNELTRDEPNKGQKQAWIEFSNQSSNQSTSLRISTTLRIPKITKQQ